MHTYLTWLVKKSDFNKHGANLNFKYEDRNIDMQIDIWVCLYVAKLKILNNVDSTKEKTQIFDLIKHGEP